MTTRLMSRPPWRVLVWPGGTEIGLEIRRSLRDLKEVSLVGAGSVGDVRGPFAFAEWVGLPDVGEDGWVDALRAAVESFGIHAIFPAHDDVLVALASRRDQFTADVIAPSDATCDVTRSKRATYERLAHVVAVPRVLDAAETTEFPVFVKPDRGEGSRGARVVHNAKELDLAIADGSDLVMEFLPGEELTVDCFSSERDGLLFSRARTRGAIRNGISGRSRSMGERPDITILARAISDELELRGPWFFQLRSSAAGVLTLLEVAPRVAGTSAVHRVAGVNFALLALYERSGAPVRIEPQDFAVEVDRPLANRYTTSIDFDTVYCDLDDFLVIDGRTVNPRAVAFLYSARNAGKRLVLLTRHAGDLDATLLRFRLVSLFDEMIIVAEHQSKAEFVTDPRSVFLDDSFTERHAVMTRRHVPTFDASGLEALMMDLA